MKSLVIILSLLSVLSSVAFTATLTQNSQSKHQSAVSKLLTKKPVSSKIVLAPIKVTVKSTPTPVVKIVQKPIILKPVVNAPIVIKPRPIIATIPKIEASPVAESLSKGFDLSVGAALRMASLSALNNAYASTFGKMDVLLESNVEASWLLVDDLRFGLRFASGQNSATKKTASTVYEDLSIRYSSLGGYLRWDLIREPSFIVATEVGLGYVLGEYAYSKVDESGVSPNLQTLRQGGVVAVNIGLMTMWNINPVWRWGLGVRYELANIKDLRRSNATDLSSQALDLSGIDVALSTTLLF